MRETKQVILSIGISDGYAASINRDAIYRREAAKALAEKLVDLMETEDREGLGCTVRTYRLEVNVEVAA